MGKKLGALTTIFKNTSTTASDPPSSSIYYWAWPSCKQPRTHSFRAEHQANSTAAGERTFAEVLDSGDSCFTHSSELHSQSFSTASDASAAESVETAVLRGARSDRLFFDPGGATSSAVVDEKQPTPTAAVAAAPEGSVAVEVDSEDPYVDFRTSMELMAAVNGGRYIDLEYMEKMLDWFLKANEKSTHGIIISAFVDLVVHLSTTSSSSSCYSSCSSSSCHLDTRNEKSS